MTTELWFPIRTERLLLRPFRRADEAEVHGYGGDPEVARFMPWGPNTEEESLAWLTKELARQEEEAPTDLVLAIALLADDKVIGSTALHLRDDARATAELGYCLNRAHWGAGIVSEAARAMVGAGFSSLGLLRIWATCNAQNVGSYRVMEKIGMRREALMRRDRMVKGEWRDTLLYAALTDEWSR